MPAPAQRRPAVAGGVGRGGRQARQLNHDAWVGGRVGGGVLHLGVGEGMAATPRRLPQPPPPPQHTPTPPTRVVAPLGRQRVRAEHLARAHQRQQRGCAANIVDFQALGVWTSVGVGGWVGGHTALGCTRTRTPDRLLPSARASHPPSRPPAHALNHSTTHPVKRAVRLLLIPHGVNPLLLGVRAPPGIWVSRQQAPKGSQLSGRVDGALRLGAQPRVDVPVPEDMAGGVL